MPSHKRQRNETSGPATPPVVRDPLADAINYAGLHADVLLQLGDGTDVWSDAVVVSNSPWEECGRLRYHAFDLSGDDVPRLLRRALEFDRTRWVRLDVNGTDSALDALASLSPTSIDLGEMDGHCREDRKAGPAEATQAMQNLFETVKRLDMSSVHKVSACVEFLMKVISRMPSLTEVRQSTTQDYRGIAQLWGEVGHEELIEVHRSVVDGSRLARECVLAVDEDPDDEMAVADSIEEIASRPCNSVATKLNLGVAAMEMRTLRRSYAERFGKTWEDDFVQCFQRIDYITRVSESLPRRFFQALAGILQDRNCSATVAGVTLSALECFALIAADANEQKIWLHVAHQFKGDDAYYSAKVKLPQFLSYDADVSQSIDRLSCLRNAIYSAKDIDYLPTAKGFADRLETGEWLGAAKILRRGEVITGEPTSHDTMMLRMFMEFKFRETITAIDCCNFALIALDCGESSVGPEAVEPLVWVKALEIIAIHGDANTKIVPKYNLGWRECAERALTENEPEQFSSSSFSCPWRLVGHALPDGGTITVGGEELTKLQVLRKSFYYVPAQMSDRWYPLLGTGCVLARGDLVITNSRTGCTTTAVDCFVQAAQEGGKKEAFAHLAKYLEAEETVTIDGVTYSRDECAERGRNAIIFDWSLEDDVETDESLSSSADA